MKKRSALLATSLVLSCGGLPPLQPVQGAARDAIRSRCRSLFPRGEWRATHVVRAKLPLGKTATFIGVVAATGRAGAFRSLLLSPEGFVLFDATHRGGRLTTHRAVAPLDSHRFGTGMTDDIRMLLFVPDGPMLEVGWSEPGAAVCRWQRSDGHTVEAVLKSATLARVRLYHGHSVVREAVLKGRTHDGFAPEITLDARQLLGYSLHLQLLQVER